MTIYNKIIYRAFFRIITKIDIPRVMGMIVSNEVSVQLNQAAHITFGESHGQIQEVSGFIWVEFEKYLRIFY